ncbi:hypothetical protein HPB49_016115 [Dermacentor silvarum]|uniref:Uncharacterized protein n=1 Tax=Dermacentor silvarum TaxID=543639 RepID=A0ACB8CY26_DERSI|nr:hypothetical protein HPB49_016115 [Dermacentor silvarum]
MVGEGSGESPSRAPRFSKAVVRSVTPPRAAAMWLPTALLCAISVIHASTSASVEPGTDVVAKWKAIESNAKSMVQKLISMSYREVLPLIHEAELSSECFISLTSVLRGLQELNTDIVRLM